MVRGVRMQETVRDKIFHDTKNASMLAAGPGKARVRSRLARRAPRLPHSSLMAVSLKPTHAALYGEGVG